MTTERREDRVVELPPAPVDPGRTEYDVQLVAGHPYHRYLNDRYHSHQPVEPVDLAFHDYTQSRSLPDYRLCSAEDQLMVLNGFRMWLRLAITRTDLTLTQRILAFTHITDTVDVTAE